MKTPRMDFKGNDFQSDYQTLSLIGCKTDGGTNPAVRILCNYVFLLNLYKTKESMIKGGVNNVKKQ